MKFSKFLFAASMLLMFVTSCSKSSNDPTPNPVETKTDLLVDGIWTETSIADGLVTGTADYKVDGTMVNSFPNGEVKNYDWRWSDNKTAIELKSEHPQATWSKMYVLNLTATNLSLSNSKGGYEMLSFKR